MITPPPPSPKYDQENEAQFRRVFKTEQDQFRSVMPRQVLQATTTWNPANVANGAVVSTTVDCLGATPGDPVTVGFTTNGAQDLLWSGHVQAADVVRVVLLNMNGAAVDLASGTLTVLVFKRR